jgi:hypothetical protein
MAGLQIQNLKMLIAKSALATASFGAYPKSEGSTILLKLFNQIESESF